VEKKENYREGLNVYIYIYINNKRKVGYYTLSDFPYTMEESVPVLPEEIAVTKKRKRVSSSGGQEKKKKKKEKGPAPKRARVDVKPISMVPVKHYSLDELVHDMLRKIFGYIPAYHRRFLMSTSKTWNQLLNEAPLCYLPLLPLVGFLGKPPVRFTVDNANVDNENDTSIVPEKEMDITGPLSMTANSPQFWVHGDTGKSNRNHGNVSLSVFKDKRCVFKHDVDLCELDNTSSQRLYENSRHNTPGDMDDPHEGRYIQSLTPPHIDIATAQHPASDHRDININNVLYYGALVDDFVAGSMWRYTTLRWVMTHCPQCLKPTQLSYRTVIAESLGVVVLQVMIDMHALAAVINQYREGMLNTTTVRSTIISSPERAGNEEEEDSIVDWSF
jgi:hypothetical protein